MPRNITVTLADGSQHVYANTPDTVTPDQVSMRAQKDFGQGVTALDGGKGQPPAQATDAAAFNKKFNADFNARWLAEHPEEAQRRAAASRSQRVAAGGQQLSSDHSSQSGLGDALLAGIRSVPGVNYLTAAAERYLPSAITGNTSNASMGDIVDLLAARNNADYDKSKTGYYTGAITSGAGAGKLLARGVQGVARAGIPIASRAANYLQTLGTLNKGATAANAAKIATSGAGWGAAGALDTNQNPVVGAAEGAAGATLLGGSLKLAQVLSRPVRDFMRTSSAGQILSRFTSSTADDIAARAAAYREATGAEPTVFELLPLADRNKILKQGITGRDSIVEHASDAIRARAANLGPEMSALAERTTGPQRRFITQGIEADLTNARGGTPDAGDPALAGRAASSPTDMLDLRDQEARAIMAPHDATPVAGTFGDILPQTPVNNAGTITMTDADPAVTAAIRSAAPSGFRVADQGVTAGDVSDMIQTLRGDLSKGGIEGRTAQRAIDHLENVLGEHAPDAAAAHAQMTDAYAARSRMAEGMQEGAGTRLRDDIQVGTSRRQARTVRNAYDTPEGAAGRALGQSNRVLGDLAGSPEDALKATIKMARGTTGRALGENLGPAEAERLMAGARAQDTSAQALSAASDKAGGNGGAGLDAEGLVQALVGLHPSSFATTKAGSLRKLLDMTYVPENRARTMVDMLFSQDPAMTRRAINAIGNSPNGAEFLQGLARVTGIQAGSMAQGQTAPETSPEAETPSETVAEPGEEASAPAPDGIDPNVPYGRQVISKIFPEAHINEDVRDPNSKLGRENPNSEHVKTQNAVDVRPIPGMTFAQFIGKINDNGHEIVEAIDEVKHPTRFATGPHWHVVIR